MMNRRSISGLLAAAILYPVSFEVLSQSAQQKNLDDSGQSRPFRAVRIPEDRRRVLVFFDFTCPACARYSANLSSWAMEVPSLVSVSFVPVVNFADDFRLHQQTVQAGHYYAALGAATPAQLDRFMTLAYETHAEGKDLALASTWVQIVRQAGLNLAAHAKALKLGFLELQVRDAAKKLQDYKIAATPSVAIGGRYVITPDDTQGNEELFFNVLNGLTTEIL
jgi:protein dithiol oxidoreductase (disulfide-forming)